MGPGAIERLILNGFAKPANRNDWQDTRDITQGILGVEWADQAQIRAALTRLERRGIIERFGFITEWRLKESAQGIAPRIVRAVKASLSEGKT